jgi:hypothetical protein
MNGPGAVCLVPVARSLVTESFMGSFNGPIKALSFLRGSAELLNLNFFFLMYQFCINNNKELLILYSI